MNRRGQCQLEPAEDPCEPFWGIKFGFGEPLKYFELENQWVPLALQKLLWFENGWEQGWKMSQAVAQGERMVIAIKMISLEMKRNEWIQARGN